jgi:hypothetical protein
MRSMLLADQTIVLSQRKAVPSRRIMLRRVTIGLMTVFLLSLTGVGLASAQAVTETVVIRTPVDEDGQFVCTSGLQHLTGEIQTVFHVTEDGAGGFTIVSNSNYVNFTGLDSETGQQYRATGSAFGNTTSHVGEVGFPATTTLVGSAHVIAQGPPDPGLTYEVLIQQHITVTANGDIVVDRNEFREECH